MHQLEEKLDNEVKQDQILNEGIGRLIDAGNQDEVAFNRKLDVVHEKIQEEAARLRREFKVTLLDFEARLTKDQTRRIERVRGENDEHAAYISTLHVELENTQRGIGNQFKKLQDQIV